MTIAKLIYYCFLFGGFVLVLWLCFGWLCEALADPNPENSETHSATRYGFYDEDKSNDER